jgi:hypothetical protein
MVRSACSCASSSSTLDTNPESLAIDGCDDIDYLREVLCAYTCIEKLIEPLELGDSELIGPTRTELGALVRLVNEEMGRRIDLIDRTLQSIRSVLSEGSVSQSP